MSKAVLPTDRELPALVVGPRSITWRRASDSRTLLAAGYALVLQVAHPTVGAGVAEHSSYKQDPWGRLFRTLDFTNSLIYAEPPVAAAVARRLRSRHARIKGVKADGSRYHALEPAAYAWVHATLFEAIASAHARFGDPLRPDQRRQFWAEWRRLGRLLGIRERDLPAPHEGFREYFDAMLADVLEDNESVHGVIESLGEFASPPLPRYVVPAWKLGAFPAGRLLRLATVGMLPPLLRKRFSLGWTRAQELELRALGAASRAATPLMPRSLRVVGPSYLRWRNEERVSARATTHQATRAVCVSVGQPARRIPRLG
jgi:uncharacterized protein (DUF2236 family)